ncbi:Ankyrin repeat domain containing protein [Pandoravirus neocaledonia]|uniref:Ankyrin repeat domain containing protein n=1 Tax=Pandoravirus neocaledonia TaxID=2107708 RepID=A0A2U7UD84_9VIRU|nr:Ankyrin repeat domain containing protein [Pandoravirus neocaledonia]AVK76387.1 Ankyrin repeat domain containing protein [Pandoravirus neocaledonia]
MDIRPDGVAVAFVAPDGDINNKDNDDTTTSSNDSSRPDATTINCLPNEVLLHILNWLPCTDRTAAASVDRWWRSLFEDTRLLWPPPCIGASHVAAIREWPLNVHARGHKEVCVTYVHAAGCPCHANRLVDAVKHWRADLIMPLVRGHAPKFDGACLIAARRGDMLALKTLWCVTPLTRGSLPFRVAEVAAQFGQMDALKFAVSVLGGHATSDLCIIAAGAGRLKATVYIHQHGAPLNRGTFRAAAASGRLAVFRYLCDNGCPRDDWVPHEAVTRGHDSIVDHALGCGLGWTRYHDYEAALGNHLNVLLVARAYGYPWTAWVCSGAARNGHLDLIKEARAVGCPWDGGTCEKAARNGRLGVLTYAVEHGCPMGKHTARKACYGGHLDCLVYAHQHGAPLDDDDCWLAACTGHIDCMEYVHAQGFCNRKCRKCLASPKGSRSVVASAMSGVKSATIFVPRSGVVCVGWAARRLHLRRR